jgi:hypothetical protein
MNAKTTAKIETISAIALTIGLAVGFVQFAPSMAQAITQFATVEAAGNHDITHMPASRKTRCIMPEALRTACDL